MRSYFWRGLQVVFLGDEFVLIQGLLLLVGALEAVHLGAVLQHVLTDVQLLLLHLDLGVAEDVLLLGQLGLGVQDLQVQVVVIEDEDGVPRLHRRAFLDEDHAAFLRAQLDGRHRLHAAADADIVVELPSHSASDGQCILVHAQRLVVRPCDQIHDKRQQQRSQPPRQGLLRERDATSGFLFDNLIHNLVLFRFLHPSDSE